VLGFVAEVDALDRAIDSTIVESSQEQASA